ncbi:MAG: sensor histidine kinase N-terminal domain-containing protein [Betaproteobacteria bacterium]|nr:sensor histidine kinase N-terminal domain-containing protein [Betaproteobacteria bacterium]
MAKPRESWPARAAGPPEFRSTRGSLFGEMFDWMLAPFLLVWPLSVGVTYLIGISLANDAFDRTLASKTRALTEQVSWAKNNGQVELRTDLRTMLADDDVESHFYRIDSVKGVFLKGDGDLPAFTTEQLLDDGLVAFRTVDFHDTSVRIAALQRAPDANGSGLVVYVAETTEKRRALAREIMKGIVFPQLLVVPLMIFLMWLGLRRGAQPLERLRRQVMARKADDMRPLEAPDVPEEVSPLINSFNELLRRAENEGAAQKRFIANAAHQLRTPLAGIRMQTELALRSNDAGERNDALTRIAQGTESTAHLINQLLMLARTEGASSGTLPFMAFDFRPVVRDVVAEAYPRASAKQIDIGFEAPDVPVMLTGNADLLRELVSNLVDNAIRYTPACGRISARLLAGDVSEGVVLEVEDTGIGIPPAERDLVFERFYRVVGTAVTGSGIGLAIVREIAARHAASVSVDTPAGGTGSVFRVRFAGSPSSVAK